jgi:hypothetical protein
MPTKSSLDFVPVRVPLGLIEDLTPAQIERLRVLIGGFHADGATLIRDSWRTEQEGCNVLFTLTDSAGNGFFSGLIEPDGRAHT